LGMVIQGSDEVWVEFQVPTETPPYPIILGTNCLSSLGCKFMMPNGQDYLLPTSALDSHVEVKLNSSVVSTVNATISPFSTSSIRCESSVYDGIYLFKKDDDEFIIEIKSNQVSIPISNSGDFYKTISTNSILGDLEPIKDIYTSSDVIASNIAEELVKESHKQDGSNKIEKIFEQLSIPEKENLTEIQSSELRALIQEYQDIFALSDAELGQTDPSTRFSSENKVSTSSSTNSIRTSRKSRGNDSRLPGAWSDPTVHLALLESDCAGPQEGWFAAIMCGLPTTQCDHEEGCVPGAEYRFNVALSRKVQVLQLVRPHVWLLANQDGSSVR